MNTFFAVYVGDIPDGEQEKYIEKISDLVNPRVIAVFANKAVASAYALSIDDRNSVVVNRTLAVDSIDAFNLVSYEDWSEINELMEGVTLTIVGTVKEGEELSAFISGPTEPPYDYIWATTASLLNLSPIVVGHEEKYTPQDSDVGKYIILMMSEKANPRQYIISIAGPVEAL
jgi:hypothetical protein